jgi:hypothetical protein
VLLRIPQGYLCHCLHLTLDRGCPGTCQQTSAPLGDPRSPRSLSQSSSTSFISVSLHTYTPPPISPAISHSPTTALLPTTLPLSPSRHTPHPTSPEISQPPTVANTAANTAATATASTPAAPIAPMPAAVSSPLEDSSDSNNMLGLPYSSQDVAIFIPCGKDNAHVLVTSLTCMPVLTPGNFTFQTLINLTHAN